MSNIKEKRIEVLNYLKQLKANNAFDSFKAHDDIRERFKLTRTQAAEIMQKFRETN